MLQAKKNVTLLVSKKKVVILQSKSERESHFYLFGVWCNWQHYRFWSCLSWFESGYPNKFASVSKLQFVWGMV